MGTAPQQAQAPDIRERAFQFAVRVVRLGKYLDAKPGTPRSLSRQLLRSGTSVGSNLEEAQGAHTKRDFTFKNEIALKEARETKYWLRLLVASQVIGTSRVTELQREADELARIIGAIIISAKENP